MTLPLEEPLAPAPNPQTLYWDNTGEVRCWRHQPPWDPSWEAMPETIIHRMQADGHQVCCLICTEGDDQC